MARWCRWRRQWP
uniref:Uncharacterized protein n=1 Tax=Arundo donax TaxID=35708 RepID=A0A0A8ZEV5_ARUDO